MSQSRRTGAESSVRGCRGPPATQQRYLKPDHRFDGQTHCDGGVLGGSTTRICAGSVL